MNKGKTFQMESLCKKTNRIDNVLKNDELINHQTVMKSR